MTDDKPATIAALERQATGCEMLGSPFSAELLRRSAAEASVVEPLFAPWAGEDTAGLFREAIPIRFLGALHDLALSGDDPALAAAYPAPDRPGDPDRAWAAARAAIAADMPRFERFMSHEPQTNEVGRSAGLLGGFLEIARATGRPLRLFEIGASAGLNQVWDRFHYRLGEGEWGDQAARVRLSPEWTGGLPPLDVRPQVIERHACDRRPVCLGDPEQRRRLQAFIWAGQFERMERLSGAIDEALAVGVQVEAADAVAWTEAKVAPQAGAATVLYHSVFWQYMPAESRDRLRGIVAAIGARATAEAPFAWLRFEPTREDALTMEVRVTLWPDGERRLLARCHSHGAAVEWVG